MRLGWRGEAAAAGRGTVGRSPGGSIVADADRIRT